MPRKPMTPKQKRQASANELKRMMPAKDGDKGPITVDAKAFKRAIGRLEK